ncbi:MAG: 5-formyltetrahydrofolate cyclo-ligase [Verrucomicrobiota bacterium]
MNSIAEEKKRLRQAMLARLAQLPADDRDAESKVINSFLAALPVFQTAKMVAAFAPLRSEPDVLSTLFAAGKSLCFPVIDGHSMTFHEVSDPGEFVKGPFGVRAPNPRCHPVVSPDSIDLILVPGLAFTRDGRRLGRGGGFYDRYLGKEQLSATRVGLCFHAQQVGEIPTEAFDARIENLITGEPSGEE